MAQGSNSLPRKCKSTQNTNINRLEPSKQEMPTWVLKKNFLALSLDIAKSAWITDVPTDIAQPVCRKAWILRPDEWAEELRFWEWNPLGALLAQRVGKSLERRGKEREIGWRLPLKQSKMYHRNSCMMPKLTLYALNLAWRFPSLRLRVLNVGRMTFTFPTKNFQRIVPW